MSNPWDPAHAIDGATAEALLRLQFPALNFGTLEELGVGWDNTAFVTTTAPKLVFRFPRRDLAERLMRTECRILPHLAPHLPMQIPAPTHIGEPALDYPYPFAGYPFLPGQTGCRAGLPERGRSKVAVGLGKFLRALHDLPPTIPNGDVPGDELGRADLANRQAIFIPRVVQTSEYVIRAGFDPIELLKAAEELARTPPPPEPLCWVHGDLYSRHILVGEDGGLAGVIDWGDVHVGSRELDLFIAFIYLCGEDRRIFFEEYGPASDEAILRARYRALFYGPILIKYGIDIDDPALEAIGVFALRHSLD